MTTWAAGIHLGPYALVSRIGAGGMGEVWKARDSRLDRIVAVKRLTQHSDRFEREARAIAALNHPHICQIHDVGPDYLVLEYIEGRPIRGPLPVAEALRLASQIASALEEAHRKGVFHRDLKPANIMVTDRREGSSDLPIAKLLDFGLATLVDAEADVTRMPTQGGTVLGTPAYMAPEQAEGRHLDARADIFSFGAVLYELLSGTRAFPGDNSAQVLTAVLRDDPAPLQTTPGLDRLVRRCLEKQRERRFQTIAEVRAAIEQLGTTSEVSDRKAPSIAVLPFANLSADPDNEYFSDGLTDEIIHALAQIRGLTVIARTSAFVFKGKNEDVRRIAETLGVAHLLDGSVRKSGTRIRVTTQLIAASDGAHLWSQRYDSDLADVFAVQDQIAAAIAAALRVKLEHAPKAYAPRREAHDALLKGRHHLFKATPEAIGVAGEYFRKAVQLDPAYAAAYAWLGSYYWMLTSSGYTVPAREAMPLGRAAALRAVELDPSSADAQAVLCVIAAQFDYDWPEAERRFLRATSGPAVSPEAHRMCGFNFLLSVGRPLEAARRCELAVREDPLNSFAVMQWGVCLHAAGENRAALDCYRQAVELDDRNFLAHLNHGLCLLEEGRLDEAASAADIACAIAPTSPWALACKAATRKLKGDKAGADDLLARLGPSDKYGTAAGLCRYYMLVQDLEAAAEWAAKAIEQRDGALPFALQFSCARALRASPHWPKLARMMNLG